MSLRLRVVLVSGIALALLWALAAAWMLRDMHGRLDRTLDQRLAMSARMVSGLLQRSALVPGESPAPLSESIRVGGGEGIACQIRTLRGEIVVATDSGLPPQAGAPAPGYADRRIEGASWRTYTLQFGDYLITTADRRDERDDLVRGILLAAGIPFLVALLGGLFALWHGIDRALRPLHVLRRTLESRDADATTPVEDNGAPPELRPMINALNDLLVRLSTALRQQRAFTDAAAHELRTPLTAIDTHLQVARMRGADVADASMDAAAEGVRRMRRTLEQMLMLARAEASVAVEDACESVTDAVIDALHVIPETGRARVSTGFEGEDAPSPVPHSMIVTAVRNVLDNALRYAPDSPVAVDVVFDHVRQKVLIQVQDQGPGVPADQLHRMGSRFWRGGRRSDGQGAGLGMSIVNAIAARHGGSVSVRTGDEGGRGLRVAVSLPIMAKVGEA